MNFFPQTCNVTKQPSLLVLDCLSKIVGPIRYAEVGVYEGHTFHAVMERVPTGSVLSAFDFDDRILKLIKACQTYPEIEGHEVDLHMHGNSHRMYDSYNWQLMRVWQMGRTFNLIYLDGAHTWHHDALAFFMLDQMLEEGGYFVFDDADWSIAGSRTMNPNAFPIVKQQYTEEQIESKQVKLIIDLLVKGNPTYEEIIPYAVYRKTA